MLDCISLILFEFSTVLCFSSPFDKFDKYSSRRKILSFSNDSRLIYNLANNLFDQKLFLDAITQYKKIPEKDRLIYALAVKNMKKAEKQLKFKNK